MRKVRALQLFAMVVVAFLLFQSHVMLARATTGSYSDDFSKTIYEDKANTTALWDTTNKRIIPVGFIDIVGAFASTSLTGVDSGKWINASAIDPSYGIIYFGGSGGQIVSYNIASGIATERTSDIWGSLTPHKITDLSFDTVRKKLYIGTDAGQLLGCASLAPSGPTCQNITPVIAPYVGSDQVHIAYDGVNNMLYVGSGDAVSGPILIKIDPTNLSTSTNLSSLFAGTAWFSKTARSSITSMAYDGVNHAVWIGGKLGTAARYTVGSGVLDDETGAISSFWSASTAIAALSVSGDGSRIYLGGENNSGTLTGQFGYINTTDLSAVDLTAVAAKYRSPFIASLLYLPAQGAIIVGMHHGTLIKYIESSGTVFDYTPLNNPGSMLPDQSNAIVFDQNTNNLFVGGSYNYLGPSDSYVHAVKYVTEQVGQSVSVATTATSITQATLAATSTLNSGTVAYYLSADGGGHWESVTPGVAHPFQYPGTSLLWRVVLTGDAYVSEIAIDFVAQDAPMPVSGGGLPPEAYNKPFAPLGVAINQRATTTLSRQVVLTIAVGSNVTDMALSNVADFSGISQQPYVSSTSWDLCSGLGSCDAGMHTVYAKFYTRWGQVSAVTSSSIILSAGNQSALPSRAAASSTFSSSASYVEQIHSLRVQLLALLQQLLAMLVAQLQGSH
jgi:hypothetical protein